MTDANKLARYADLANLVDELHDENMRLRQQLADYNSSYENACNLVARMHAAAVGEVTGPRRGIVEDVEDMHQQLTAKQAEVDALMLEYCPSEIPQEQLDNWAAHQRPAKEQWK